MLGKGAGCRRDSQRVAQRYAQTQGPSTPLLLAALGIVPLGMTGLGNSNSDHGRDGNSRFFASLRMTPLKIDGASSGWVREFK